LNPKSKARAALVAALALSAFAATARADDPWGLMPESASAEADTIDSLTYLILWITGITFVGVQAILVVFLFKYRRRGNEKGKFTHGNHAVELVWTVAPALILVFLALYQMNLWLELKRPAPADNAGATQVQVLAKQFEWNVRYAGPDATFGTGDDRVLVSAMVVPVGRPVNATMRSMDVIHSFYLPNFRTKQDAVPGLTIPFWFKPNKLSADRKPVRGRDAKALEAGREEWVDKHFKYWDIVCAELCGNSHTNMAAQLYVVTEEQYAQWQKDPATTPELPRWTQWNKANPIQTLDQVWVRWDWTDRKFEDGDPAKRQLMAPAKLKREPFGEDETHQAAEQSEDI
jgi:cytochrome c oxidase subunit 2